MPATTALQASAVHHQVLCLLYPGMMSLDVTGPMQVFATANDERARHGLPPHYRLVFAAQAAGPVATTAGLRLHADCGWRDVPLHTDMDCKGPHYGVPDAQTVAALEWAAREEGVLLDPVYSAKGFAGLLQACAPGGALHSARHVVFLHTGGQAAMSAYPEVAAA